MTDQELNAAIAEHCGWRFHNPDMAHLKHEAIMCWIRPGGSDWQLERVPDYTADLNAMHEAERKLQINEMCEYVDTIDKVCVPVHICHYTHAASVIMATARQRAEAFVRTIGKWKA